ncbi:putative het domain protein [Botrytis cinerea BcDW1]|nr:putative het domain protein [Botrytis cinerea BcDW1]
MATKLHDKIYALLSMSFDTSNVAGLSPDYRVTWTTLLERLVKFVLFKDVSVKAWEDKEIVLIESKGYVIGHVSSIDADSTRYDRQYVSIVSNNQSEFDNKEHTTRWLLHASAKPIRQGDLVCLLQGASKPSIIRAYKDHFSIIVIAVTLQDKIQKKGEWFKSLRPLLSMKGFSRDFLLIWNWEKGSESLQGQVEDEDITERYTSMLEYPKMDTNKTVNSINVALALGDTRNYEKAKNILQIQVANYEGVLERESLDMLALKESLAWIYREKNKQMLAENLFLQVIETRKGFQGINHRATLSSMARLGLVYMLAELSPQNHRKFITRLSNQIENNDQISEEDMIKVGNLSSHKMMKLLLELKRDNVEVTEEVVKAVASNYYGESIMKLILEKRGEEIIITEEALKAIASNEYAGEDIMELILEKREEIIITEEVLKAAASNHSGGKILELILEKREEIIITEKVLRAAANNYYGEEILELILKKRGEVIITEEVLNAAAHNYNGGKILELILEKREEIIITEKVLEAAASNYNGEKILELILKKRGEVIITEEVLKAAVSTCYGESTMKLILEKRGEVIITEEVLKAAAGNGYYGKGIIELILKKREEVIITEEVLKAAAGNGYHGKEIIELILKKREEVIITEEVLKAARRNERLGQEGMRLLLEHQAKHTIILEEGVKTATTDE